MSSLPLQIVPFHGCQHRCRLLASHDRDAAVGPGEEEPRSKRSAAHAVIAGAKDPPMMTVIFGTCAQATALTNFAPSFAIPPASYLRPTMKPEMF